jgi:hypothetical protein
MSRPDVPWRDRLAAGMADTLVAHVRARERVRRRPHRVAVRWLAARGATATRVARWLSRHANVWYPGWALLIVVGAVEVAGAAPTVARRLRSDPGRLDEWTRFCAHLTSWPREAVGGVREPVTGWLAARLAADASWLAVAAYPAVLLVCAYVLGRTSRPWVRSLALVVGVAATAGYLLRLVTSGAAGFARGAALLVDWQLVLVLVGLLGIVRLVTGRRLSR